MSFLKEELINFAFKGWQSIAGTLNKDAGGLTWYEELFTNNMTVLPSQILAEFDEIPPAITMTEADNNAILHSSIIHAHNLSDPIHLTPLPGNKAFVACETYGDLQSRLLNFIMPQQIPRTDAGWEGYPSIGYAVKLYNGDPNNGGTEITTTIGQNGSVVGWFFMYGSGLVIVSDDFNGIIDPSDVWITGYRYVGRIGSTVSDIYIDHTDRFVLTETDCINKMISLSHIPSLNKHVFVYQNGLIMDTEEYTLSGSEILFTDIAELTIGDILIIKFSYLGG